MQLEKQRRQGDIFSEDKAENLREYALTHSLTGTILFFVPPTLSYA